MPRLAQRRPLLVAVAVAAWVACAAAAPVRVRYREGPAHGFIKLCEVESGRTIAHGEMLQWMERSVVASRLVLRFDDGSRYDEVVRFTQQPVFRLVAYERVQRGPSFTESDDVRFDASGRYHARTRSSPDAEEKTADGRVDLPDDVSNGMTSTLLKNLMPGSRATTHMVTFRPEPLVLELRLAPEATDTFRLGRDAKRATRYRVEPHVTGVTGMVASIAAKQPPTLAMWIVQGAAPTFVKFEGPLYADGPPWRIELATPVW
jgi:hypothetical protein